MAKIVCSMRSSTGGTANRTSLSALYAGSVASCKDYPNKVIYQFDMPSVNWWRPRGRPSSHWKDFIRQHNRHIYYGAVACSNALPRPWESEGQGCPCRLNVLMLWIYSAVLKHVLSLMSLLFNSHSYIYICFVWNCFLLLFFVCFVFASKKWYKVDFNKQTWICWISIWMQMIFQGTRRVRLYLSPVRHDQNILVWGECTFRAVITGIS